MKLFDVRCPLGRNDGSLKPCNRLCVRVSAGSSGEAFCPRHEKRFEFHVDDHKYFVNNKESEKPQSEAETSKPAHPSST